jgi:hypothetical protein
MKASHKDRFIKFHSGKGDQQVHVTAGQFVFGRNKAAEVFGWSPSTVWNRLQRLADIICILIQSNNQYSIVTICNWRNYQSEEEQKVTTNGQPIDNQLTTNGQPIDTNKNVKNVENVKKKDICTDEQKMLANRLLEVVSLRRKTDQTKATSWVNTIRLMMDRDKISAEKILSVISWYEINWMNEFVPVVESASSLRDKWGKLLNAIDRAENKGIICANKQCISTSAGKVIE